MCQEVVLGVGDEVLVKSDGEIFDVVVCGEFCGDVCVVSVVLIRYCLCVIGCSPSAILIVCFHDVK